MVWIESHPQLESHPKVYDLMSSLSLDLDQTIGKIHRFWWWCTKYAEDGDLRKHNDDRLARAVGLNGGQEACRFVEAMVASCWIDREPYFRVHDWWDYFGYYLMRKYGDAPAKWKRIKALYVTVQEPVHVLSGPFPSLPSPSVPNQRNTLAPAPKLFVKPTLEDIQQYALESNLTLDAAQVLDHYEANGWRVGRTPMKDWKAAVRNWDRRNKAGGLYAQQSRTNGGYIGAPPVASKYAESANKQRNT